MFSACDRCRLYGRDRLYGSGTCRACMADLCLADVLRRGEMMMKDDERLNIVARLEALDADMSVSDDRREGGEE